MVHVTFDPASVTLDGLFIQEGGGLYSGQHGYGYFRGNIFQRGTGFGNLFQSLWRFIVPLARQAGQTIAPLAKEAVREIGKEGLSTASRVLSNIAEGASPAATLQEEGQQGLQNLVSKAKAKLQKGGALKRRKRSRPGAILKPIDLVGRSVAKTCLTKTTRPRSDGLGFY
ncbi:hypothetical protein AAVH_33604 [Aphelenchoides avenae]|nr:hypothetical protein AAVH_33604 [Aphelenchus avenae]